MNLSRGWLSPGRPRRLVPACLSVALCALAPRVHAVWEGPLRAGQEAEADVLPGSTQMATPDLQLQGDNSTKADALAAFSQAIIAEDNADSDKALADYQKALALDPGYTELAVKVAFELARRGDASGGVEVLKDTIKANPKAALAYLYLSQLYSKYLGKEEAGLKYAQQALDLDPTNFASYIAVYEIDLALNQHDKALAVLGRAEKVDSKDPQFYLQLAQFYLKAYGDSPVPPAQVGKIGGVLRKVLALAPEDPQALAEAGDFFERTHQEKEAIPLYLSAIKFSPANAVEGDDALAKVRSGLARCFDAVGRTKEAIATMQQLIKDNPLRYDSYDLLCGLYEKTDNNEAAIGVCQQMMLLDPTDYRNYIRLAALQLKEKKEDAAIQTLTDARAKFPDNSEIGYTLGLVLSEMKHFREAVAVFEQTDHEASAGSVELLDARFYCAYGEAAGEAGDMDKASEMLKKSIQLDPQNSAEAYNSLGYMWVDHNTKLDEAGELIKKALQLDPDNPAYIDSMGWYYFKKGDVKHALETLRKAASLIQPEDSTVDEHLGDAYNAANDTARALDYWQRSLALDKDNKELAVKVAGAKQRLAGKGAPANTTP